MAPRGVKTTRSKQITISVLIKHLFFNLDIEILVPYVKISY